MRKNQITVKLERFSDESPNGKSQTIEIYADSNNVWEAIAAANQMLANEISRTQEIPHFGTVDASNSVFDNDMSEQEDYEYGSDGKKARTFDSEEEMEEMEENYSNMLKNPGAYSAKEIETLTKWYDALHSVKQHKTK